MDYIIAFCVFLVVFVWRKEIIKKVRGKNGR